MALECMILRMVLEGSEIEIERDYNRLTIGTSDVLTTYDQNLTGTYRK